jgi:hypothetical protein
MYQLLTLTIKQHVLDKKIVELAKIVNIASIVLRKGVSAGYVSSCSSLQKYLLQHSTGVI